MAVDMVAQRYGCLPSDLIRRGDSIDMEIAMWSMRRQQALMEQDQTGKKKAAVPDVNTLQAMMNRVRNR